MVASNQFERENVRLKRYASSPSLIGAGGTGGAVLEKREFYGLEYAIALLKKLQKPSISPQMSSKFQLRSKWSEMRNRSQKSSRALSSILVNLQEFRQIVYVVQMSLFQTNNAAHRLLDTIFFIGRRRLS